MQIAARTEASGDCFMGFRRLDIQMAIKAARSLVGGEGQQHIEGVIVGAINV